MVYKKLACQTFWIVACAVTFYVSGCLGLICESIHGDLFVSSTVFSVSFASIFSMFAMIYYEITSIFFG